MSRKDLILSKINGQMQLAAVRLVENEFEGKPKTLEELGDELGISRSTLYLWRKNPDFVAYMQMMTDDMMASKHAYVMSKLIDAIECPNGQISTKAIELYAKLRGLLVDKKQIGIEAEVSERPMDNENIRKSIDEIDVLLSE